MKVIIYVSELIYKIERIIVGIMLTIILFSLTLGVLFRYIFKNPLSWSDEISMFSFVWLTFVGGSMTIKKKLAPTINFFIDELKGNLRIFVISLSNILILLFVSFVFYISIIWITSPNIYVQHSGSIGLPMIYSYASIPISFLFLFIHSLELTILGIFSKKEV